MKFKHIGQQSLNLILASPNSWGIWLSSVVFRVLNMVIQGSAYKFKQTTYSLLISPKLHESW